MKSNLQKAIEDGAIYCSINSKTNFTWRDFTLQSGHIYGYSPELKRNGLSGLFVVYQVKKDHIVVRVAHKDRSIGKYVWRTKAIGFGCETSKVIADVNRRRIGGVELPKYDISSFFKPKLTTDPFIPMPHMRIPMGNRGGNVIISDSKRNNLTATSSGEFFEKLREHRLETVMETLDLRIERAKRRGEI